MTDSTEMLRVIQQELVDYVTHIPFDNTAVVLSWLHWLQQPENAKRPIEEVFNDWAPQSDRLVSEFGGTNCVGATKIFRERLAQKGIESQIIISPSNNLPEGVSDLEVPFQHAGLMVTTPDGNMYFVEPGLGLVVPVPADNTSVEMADRIYQATATGDTGELQVIKPDGSRVIYDFIYWPPDAPDIEQLVQKPLLRATTAFKIDVFSSEGEKRASIKIDLYREKITYLVNGVINAFDFDEVDQMFDTDSFTNLVQMIDHLSVESMKDRIRETIDHKDDIVETWLYGLQEQFYLDNPDRLSPIETSWDKLQERGYKGGGVVIVLLNEKNQVMVYQVPKGKAKPYLNRYEGQLNLFVETADHTDGGDQVSDLEDFQTNLRRGFEEEIGIGVPDDFIYREVDYMPNIRARCAVFQVSSDILDRVTAYSKARNERLGKEEIGPAQWIDPAELEANWIEPNAKAIILKMIKEGIIPTPKKKTLEQEEMEL